MNLPIPSEVNGLRFLNQLLEDHYIVSKTDAYGNITEVNDLFCQIAGYAREELIGQPHKIIRHPDTPPEVFRDLWATLKEGRPWQGTIKNSRKDGTPYWVRAVIYPNPDPDSPHKYIALRDDITAEMRGQETNRNNAVLYDLLRLAGEGHGLRTFLEKTLEALVAIPWLSLQAKAGIMLTTPEGDLKLTAWRGVGDSLVKLCDRVEFGQCLCGLAAQKKELVFADCVDERHHNRPEGMTPHGHYNMPLVKDGEVLGVLFLYVNHGHVAKVFEREFLDRLGSLLANTIDKYRIMEKEEKLTQDLQRSNLRLDSQVKQFWSLQSIIRQYTPATVWQSALQAVGENKAELPSERRKFSFLFCDMKDFTRLSENNPADIIIGTINEFFDPAVAIIEDNSGDVERFMGDSFFAVFDRSRDAGWAAVTIARRFREINRAREKQGQDPIFFRMGLHTGEAVRGNIGGMTRKEYTVMGMGVNLASRLEGKCEPGKVLISRDFYESQPGDFIIGDSVDLKVKGVSEPVSAFYLKGMRRRKKKRREN